MFRDGDLKHYIIRKYHAYFAALFSDIHLDRTVESNGQLAARFRVPLHFADVEHALQRVLEDPTKNRGDAIVLPAMSWEFKGLKYNGDRHQPSRNRFVSPSSDPSLATVMHASVPYDLSYQVGILTKNYDDGIKIIEEIAVYFTPDYTATLELVPEMNLSQEIPVVLDGVNMDYEIPADFKDRVTLVWTLDFTLQGYLYGPEKRWPLIKFSNIDLSIAPDITTMGDFSQNNVVVICTSTPGLTANGQPTTDPSLSVNALAVPITSDYGYIDTDRSTIK